MNRIIRKKCDCRIRNIAGKIYLIPIMSRVINGEHIYELNETANIVWDLVSERDVKIEDIITKFDEFILDKGMDKRILKDDIENFIKTLTELELVKVEDCSD